MRGRIVYAITAVIGLTGAWACWCGAALTWDGAYQFCRTLVEQHAYAYGGRLHSWLLWQPVVALSHFTRNPHWLEVVYGLPFAAAPVVGLLVSWWVVKSESPRLLVWAVFGIAAAPLPGQIFLINDSIFQQHLFWPVFLGLFVTLTPAKRIVLTLLALFQLAHPIGIVLLMIGATAAAITGWRQPARRRQLLACGGVLVGLALLAIVKLLLFPDSQAADEFHFFVAQNRWRKGVSGQPLAGLRYLWLAAVLVLTVSWINAKRHPQIVRWIGAVAVGCAIAGGAVWVVWATDEHRWAFALDYRRWLVPLTVPFFALCVLDALVVRFRIGRVPHLSPSASRTRARVCCVIAGTFAAVLATQSTLWSMLTRRLVLEAEAYPRAVVPRSAMPWIEHTPLMHWGAVSCLSVLEGPSPRRVLIFESADRAPLMENPPRIPISPWEGISAKTGAKGWFDFRPLLKSLSEKKG